MANVPKKVAVIGLDCAEPKFIEQYIAEGHLPTFKKLIEGGVIADNCLVPYPTVTPPNWTTIGTGASAGTHGITDFHVEDPGAPLEAASSKEAFSSERSQAEYVWDAADKAGKKCIVLNFPGSWPSHMKDGIMVGGGGLSVGEWRDGLAALNSHVSLCHDQVVTTGVYPATIRGTFEEADDWDNAPDMGENPLEMEFALRFPGAEEKPAPATWYMLARRTGGDGYDKVTLSPTKDFKDAFCTLGVGEWSPKIVTNIKMPDGSEREVFFRCKLLELSDDAEDFRFLITALGQTSGWSSPPEIAKEIVSEEGTLVPGGGVTGYALGWFDLDTYVELNDQYTKWMADAAATLLTNHEWDLFFMHSHPTDWIYHVLMTDMDPDLTKDEATRKKAWDAHFKIYQQQDELLAKILEVVGSDTLVMLVSDHGAVPDGTPFSPYSALAPAGLVVFEEKIRSESAAQAVRMKGMFSGLGRSRVPDPAKSKAIPMNSLYVYINLKGRNPDGIVEPADYEKVQQEIIDVLLTYVDPETGKRPVAMALSKQDARLLGLYGDNVGDVVWAQYPEFGGQHGNILPAAEWGIGSLKAIFTMTGPGIKKGARLERTVSLNDIVPTICYLMDLPLPEQAEGAILYQALKDPNVKLKEISKLKDAVGRMETAIARGAREPWDKMECA